MPFRIYLIKGPRGTRLVEAQNAAVAVNHCARIDYACEVAGQQDLVDLTKQGTKVERAGAKVATIDPES